MHEAHETIKHFKTKFFYNVVSWWWIYSWRYWIKHLL